MKIKNLSKLLILSTASIVSAMASSLPSTMINDLAKPGISKLQPEKDQVAQLQVNQALKNAVQRNKKEIVESLLNSSSEQLRPDQNTLIGEYNSYEGRRNPVIQDILQQHILPLPSYLMNDDEKLKLEKLQNTKNDFNVYRDLQDAAKSGQQALVRQYLLKNRHHAKVALEAASEIGDKDMIEMVMPWIELSQNDFKENIGMALVAAAKNNQRNIVETFLKSPFDQKHINWALGAATARGHKAIAELLLDQPVGHLKPNQEGIDNALERAACNKFQDIVRLLITRPDGPSQDSVNQALMMTSGPGSQATIEILLKEGLLHPDLETIIAAFKKATTYTYSNEYEFLKSTALALAAYVPEAVKLNQGYEVSWQALKQNEILVTLQQDFNHGFFDQNGINNALEKATTLGMQDIIAWLLSLSPNKAPDQDGMLHAMWAAARIKEFNNVPIIKQLLESNKHNLLNQDIIKSGLVLSTGEFGVESSDKVGNVEAVKCILNNPSLPPDQDSIGEALSMAAARGQKEIVSLLIGATPNHSQETIDQALNRASANGHLPVVELLLNQDVSFKASLTGISRALTTAGQCLQPEVIAYLLNLPADQIPDQYVVVEALNGAARGETDNQEKKQATLACLLNCQSAQLRPKRLIRAALYKFTVIWLIPKAK
ncbi:MAG: ankyrin repeat domain-containing protein [Alphaproteobacteria bacterium]|nr:ankyrin repeat domain-containing protein [Alphaproteobacteria bacterium]